MAEEAMVGDAVLKPAKASAAMAEVNSVEALADIHMLMVFRICWSILRNHHDAEDAVQECFLRVLKFQDRMHEVRNPKTWLARIAWTTALDRRSRRSITAAICVEEGSSGLETIDSIPDLSMPLDELVAGREMQQILERLIAGLPDDLRQPLELSTVQELNSSEIAEIMKIPAESVRTRLLRARQLLKAKFGALLEVKKDGR
ncbi:MAG TPA: sigma-70 family RNA polymerase sigma factor [Candidatus Angelobacter sp.]|nr:sigma-70 family RNA polymerase sigma factor [Candidatus Angelobacter sp.]